MSYRVDIPTLSANEVYTLTFEYEGTETIQLIVGDLTLETTDRRVVFTTTSPVNYIESNVNLTNLNMYEGYYESDDFGGEYTQESYIEGKSLVNLIQSQKHLDFQNRDCGVETFEDNMIKLTITDVSSLTSTWQNGWIKTSANLKVGATYTCVIHVVENSISTEGMRVGANYGTLVHGSDSNSLASGETGTIVFTYTTTTATLKDYNGYYNSFCRVNSVGDWQNGSLKYGIMIFEGDYYDYFINNNIPHFEGIGCVKSPAIKSLSPENLYISPLKYREPLRGYEYYHNDGTVEIYPNGGGGYSTIDLYTGEDVGWSYTGSQKTWYVNNGIKLGLGAGTYYFCCEIELVANKQITDFTGKPLIDVVYDNAQYFGVSGNFTETYDGEKYYYKGIFGVSNKTVTDDIRGIYVGIWSYGIGGVEKYIIRNITLTKEASLKDICAISKSSIITTPDDLELYCNHHYDGNTKISNPCYQDTLDLTTGTITRKNIKVKLNDCIAKRGTVGGALVTVNGGDMVRIDYVHTNSSTGIFPVQIDGEVTGLSATGIVFSASQGSYDGRWNPTGDIEHAYTDVNTIFMFFNPSRFDGIDYTDPTTVKNWLIEQDFTLIIKIQNASVYTEQLSLNPLKSYRNGSIQTSSQQLTPTLKTTLPISNKFTTTNLTSGSTYNVYFDGTATQLDAGGTIITNPVSPCEVECGGTTLTIEGTDIQNVRVLETSVKNEVGSVCGTTDVELNRVITSDLEVITNDIEFSSVGTNNGNINTVDNKLGTINTKGGHAWGAGYFTSNKTYPKGFSLLHIEFDVNMPSDNLMAIINFNNNVGDTYYNFRDLTLDNDTATIAQGQTSGTGIRYSSIVTKGHFSRLVYCFSSQGKINLNINTGSSAMLTASGNNAEGSTSGYTACANNGITISNFKIKVIENYPDATVSSQITSSLRTNSGLTVIWQDMDMSIGQSISKLEQPIKLRSLGTTYDSYNPVTGELVKRIGVSETDGSYSVLSSPIVENISMGKTIENIFNFEEEWINKGYNTSTSWQLTNDGDGIYTLKALQANATVRVWFSLLDAEQTVGEELTTIMEVFKNTSDKSIPYWTQIQSEDGVGTEFTFNAGETGVKIIYGKFIKAGRAIDFQSIGKDSEFQFRVTIVRGLYPNIKEGFGTSKIIQVPPQLYTNGQVKVYSESDVYPTTILNGQSTNNYEINELNKSNNYTIRYDGTCESINLNGKSNEQGTNRIVETSTNGSGNLTFVNDSGDIDNVLLVQNDVREQEINHFTGLQTVEVGGLLVQNQRNMYCYKDISAPEGGYVMSLTPIPVQPGETLYCVVYNSVRYSSLIEYDSDMKQLRNTEINFGYGDNGNAVKLTENTYYIKVVTGASYENKVMISRGGFLPLELCENVYQGQYIDLPQPVQLNGLPDGTCDTYNPITGEYVQNVGIAIMDENGTYGNNWSSIGTTYPVNGCNGFAIGDMASRNNTIANVLNNVQSAGGYGTAKDYEVKLHSWGNGITNYIPVIDCGNLLTGGKNNINGLKAYLKENPIILYYQLVTPITTQLTPINIPTFEGGIVQLITTDGKVFPMIEYSMPTNNRYDTSSWETGAVYTQRNMTEAYFNESTTPMIPTETMTLTTDHISSGSIIINDNGNGLIVLKGNYTGRDIPYFTGMRSVEAIEVETTPSPDQPLFGKGGRK